jgi:hypothetical protein
MPPHRIRLHGFWSVTPLDFGRIRHARRFGRPRTLDLGETAWLVCDHPPDSGEVRLNGELLGTSSASEPFAFDVTTLLQPRNELTIDVGPSAGTFTGDVSLEIRESP